jgi:peptide deformylase
MYETRTIMKENTPILTKKDEKRLLKQSNMARVGFRTYVFVAILAVVALVTTNFYIGFTPVEQKRILRKGESTEAMHVFTNLNKRELRFLHQKAAPLSRRAIRMKEYALLEKRMLATVLDSAHVGVGIAAPQVGIGKRLIAVQRFDKEGEPFEFYINPTIEYYSPEQQWGWEGCLSVPGERDTVLRSTQVIVSYRDRDSWELLRDTVAGYTAVIFQHEVDHLNGKLYID